ncbi:O-antigen ligase family protein [Ruegeria atlantica]|uniref:O-antigen ligase family protein n=1 Tax=Ruegeria atlantica TaxID=81569 RepID=UPI002495753D|nr:O-antigen ligase family protein [Ruegeria atlantica]
MLKGHPNGMIAMAVFVFMLTAVPKLNIRVGPVPLYIIDIIIVFVIYYAGRRPGFGVGGRPFQWIILALFSFTMIGEFVGFIYTGSIFEHVYQAVRMTLAFLVFYATGQLVRTSEDLELVIKAAALGVIVTASMMILTSLPQTRGFVAVFVLDNTFLDPAGRQVAASYLNSGDTGVRGRTLVGVSILGASFINLSWPLAAILYSWPNPIGRWRTVAMVACFLAPMGVLMSYSRGPILGAILIVLFTVLLGLKRVRKGVLRPVGFGILLVMLVGVNSQVFFFDRLTNRSAAIFDNPLEDERESERLLSYVEPFEHVLEHPSFFLAGQGIAILKSNAVVPEVAGKANHALFAVSYYANGMAAAVLHMCLLGSAFFYVLRHVKGRRSGIGQYFSQALLASVVGIAPWAIFGHAMVSQPRGAMMFYFILGLLTSLRHFPVHSNILTDKETGHAYGRHIAV